MSILSLPKLPSISKFVGSSWEFDTSTGGDISAAIVAASQGSLFIHDNNDPDGIVHEVMYVGVGLAMGSPLPSASYATPDMFSTGVGPVVMPPTKAALYVNDFAGTGFIINFSGGAFAGRAYTIVFFGFPFVRAALRIKSKSYTTPAVGMSGMPVWFVLDP